MSPEEQHTAPKLAVALEYDKKKDPAPKVVAKGSGTIAEQIIKVAEQHGIAIREDADLVQILEKIDIDTIIPLEAYTAVAEILNYVYRTNADLRRAKGL